MQDVVAALREAAAAWAGPPEDRAKSYSLTATRDRCGCRPTSPDAWMLGLESQPLCVPALRRTKPVAPVAPLCHAA
eukprot:9879830-Alexandrium_andersonii.AAC.1